MKRHAARSGSGVHQIKLRVPTDVLEKARGRVLSVDLPASVTDPEWRFTVKLGQFCKGSLATRDARTADVRRLAVIAELGRLCDTLRRGPVRVSQLQVEALAGDVYKLLLAEHGENPGTEAEWARFKAITRAAAEGRIDGASAVPVRGHNDDAILHEVLFGAATGEALTQAVDGLPRSDATRALDQRFGRLALWAIGRRGIEVDPATYVTLLRRIAAAALDAGWALKRRAGGDYRPDPQADRFPAFQAKAAKVTLSGLFDRWKAEAKPAGSTVTTWKGIVADFTKHLGHDDAARVTDADVVAWKDARVAVGRSAKTINDSDLACLRALFRFGIANKVLTANPAEGVKVSAKKRAGQGRLPYTEAEIAQLLAHAEGETAAVRRWLPILLVTTGARVGELAQLTSDRVHVEDGVPVLRIEPAADGGSLKNEGSERTVPLHPALISSGFLDYALSKNGPLFYGSRPRRRKARKDGEGRHASKSAGNRFADWVRTLPGFDNPRKAPSHAVRHWWKSAAARAGVLDSVADHLQGHAASTTAGDYRHHDDLRTLAAAVARVPVPARDAGGALMPDLDGRVVGEG